MKDVGHYITAIGSVIKNNNKGKFRSLELLNNKDLLLYISIKSLMTGNGQTGPLIEYKYFPQMACQSTHGPTVDPAYM